MEKRFRLRISRIIPSFHFHFCCSKDLSNNSNSHSVPSFSRPIPVIPTVLPKHRLPSRPPLPSKPQKSSLKRHVLCAFPCGNRSKPMLSDDNRSESPPEYFRWEKEEKYWHVITTPKLNDVVTARRKIYNSSAEDDDDVLPPPPPPSAEKNRKRRNKKKKKTTSRTIRVSTSSAESGLFSSEGFDDDVDDKETETLVSSSRSISTDSLETIRESAAPDHYPITTRSRKKNKKRKEKKKKIAKRRGSETEWWGSTETSETAAAAVPARLSVFQRLIPCSLEGKVRESFAVVKRSEDPYEDFKKSMMEMILEKQMFNDEDLEQLLHCFLSLNSKHHHGAIVQAFIEIWEALFCSNSTRSSSATASSRRVSRAL